jgi:hypothetical protein
MGTGQALIKCEDIQGLLALSQPAQKVSIDVGKQTSRNILTELKLWAAAICNRLHCQPHKLVSTSRDVNIKLRSPKFPYVKSI